MLLTIGVSVLGPADASFAQGACELQELFASAHLVPTLDFLSAAR